MIEADGLLIARERIAREASERTGFLDLGRLGLRVLPEELFALKHLRRLNLGSGIVDKNGDGMPRRANIAPNDIEPFLGRLIELPELEILSVLGLGCKLASLGGIAALTALRQLDCSWTQVSDLQPLKDFKKLQILGCGATQVRDLAPLAGLAALQKLDCSGTKVSDLQPLKRLKALRSLSCFGTQVSDLQPLKDFKKLQMLSCSSTQVSDLQPLAKLVVLQDLDCFRTNVSDLQPLAGLAALQNLVCSYTNVNDLQPLAELPAFRSLDCSGCVLDNCPQELQELLFKPSLRRLILYKCRLPRVPAEVLSQSPNEDCLEALRAHVRDLEGGTAPVTDVKLMVLGNGRVGKTQLCRRLRGEAYDETEPSTHGIIVTNAPLPASDDGPPARLHIWDFGGQDIYHGTHALFMRTNAIFLLAWTPALEDVREYEHDGMLFRNHPLAYWVDCVRHLGGRGSPILVVQTQCDRPQDNAACRVPEADLFATFEFHQILRYSARTDRGRASLNDALAEATAWLREREGISVIGLGRQRLQRRLEAMRDADAALAPEGRQYRTITKAQFQALCDEAGGISSPEHLLSYLYNAGIVFYQPGLFNDAIILDQSWALEAIYAVFYRRKSYTKIRRQHGRFTRSDLENLVWRGQSVEEQKLFLSMMQSCGICFGYRWLGADDEGETEYIAPDLLPARAEIEVELEWDADLPAEADDFEYPLLHPGLMCSVISRIGGQAGLAARYWQGGVYVFEKQTKSRGLIEQEMIDDRRGRIRVQTQHGQAADLLQRLMALIEAEQNRAGMTSVVTTTAAIRARTIRADEVGNTGLVTGPAPESAAMVFGTEPGRKWYVSYAWGDDTPEGKEREAIVDRLCAKAEASGTPIRRDKNQICLGEPISKFMQELGQGNELRVFVARAYHGARPHLRGRAPRKLLIRLSVRFVQCSGVLMPLDALPRLVSAFQHETIGFKMSSLKTTKNHPVSG